VRRNAIVPNVSDSQNLQSRPNHEFLIVYGKGSLDFGVDRLPVLFELSVIDCAVRKTVADTDVLTQVARRVEGFFYALLYAHLSRDDSLPATETSLAGPCCATFCRPLASVLCFARQVCGAASQHSRRVAEGSDVDHGLSEPFRRRCNCRKPACDG
jgi:hypothetical protein